jgi:hypothetical protein
MELLKTSLLPCDGSLVLTSAISSDETAQSRGECGGFPALPRAHERGRAVQHVPARSAGLRFLLLEPEKVVAVVGLPVKEISIREGVVGFVFSFRHVDVSYKKQAAA